MTSGPHPLRVLGLDLAAANSGLCCIDVEYPKYSYKVLKQEGFRHPISDFRNRVDVTNTILEIAEELEPNLVVIEDYAMRFGKTNTSGYQHAEVGGMVKKCLHEAGFTIYIIPPTTMRSFMVIPPRSPKDLLETKAEERLGFVAEASTKKKRSDITDAFIHAHIGSLVWLEKYASLEYDLTKSERRVIYGDDKLEGLVDRSTIEYGGKEKS